MKRRTLILLGTILGLLSFVPVAGHSANDPALRKSLIVSTEWLAQHLKDDSLVLLQVGEKDEYTAAHNPGAQLIALADISTPRDSGLALELPAVSHLKDDSLVLLQVGEKDEYTAAH